MISNSIFSKSRFITTLLLSIFLMGCFGDGDDPASIAGTPKTLMGTLVDAPAAGVGYTTASDSTVRFTNAVGQFTYLEGEEVTFFVGDIMLGTVTGAAFITPVELTGSAQAADQPAVNMMVFLQSIDANQFPLDLITVSQSTRDAAAGQSLDFASPTFSTEVATVVSTITPAPGNAIVSDVDALSNFYQYGYQQIGGAGVVDWTFGGGFPEWPDLSVKEAQNANSGFETSLVDPPVDWTVINGFANAVVGSSLTPPSPAFNGTNVMELSGFDGIVGSDIVASAGIEYTASVQAWPNSDALILMEFFFFDASNTELLKLQVSADAVGNGAGAGNVGDVFLVADQWTELTATAVAPAGTVKAEMRLYHLAFNARTLEEQVFVVGNVRMDDAEIRGPDTTPPEIPLQVGELLTNGSFEDDDASLADVGCAAGWTCFEPGNFTTVAGPSAEDGSQVLKSFGANFSGAYQDVAVIANQPYTATVYGQNFTGDPLFNTVELEVIWRDSGDNTISTDQVVGKPNGFDVSPEIDMGGIEDDCGDPLDDGDNGSGCGFVLTPHDNGPPASGARDPANMDVWQEFTVTATAPANAVSARFQLLHVSDTDGPSGGNVGGGFFPAVAGGSIFWDNASLVGPVDNRVLVFADEFNGASLDTSVWNYELGYGNGGWGNDEYQQYTNESANIQIVPDDGDGNSVLRIAATCDNPPNCGKRTGEIKSARITTQDKFTFSTGTVEARIRVPNNAASWPAFWMLGARISEPQGWPKAGEIDILEVFNNKQAASGAIHFCDEDLDNNDCVDFPSGWRFISDDLNIGEDLGDQFHVYELVWTTTSVTTSIDGQEYFTISFDPDVMEEFLGEFFMLLNVAVGGNPIFPGPDPEDISSTWPMIMDVDYIRVYQ